MAPVETHAYGVARRRPLSAGEPLLRGALGRDGDSRAAAHRHGAHPSGRLAVSDPLDEKPRELTERIPPGEYALEAAVIAGEGEYGEDRFPVTEEPAVRLLIRDEPAVAWESALSESEDPRLLLDGHAYGFSTDAATGSFADAAAWETLSGKVGRHYEEQDDGACESIGNGRIRAVDVATGSDLVSFCTGATGHGRYGSAAPAPANSSRSW
ncbi:DUF4241 domain-containing protein [Streptomyces sp. NPDC102462]|uniref:DUF4241 domain-containing protein n=1 Tax=Streptomyces sp. NPDC102462 TaxID=3366178 RepID=UPI00382D06CC